MSLIAGLVLIPVLAAYILTGWVRRYALSRLLDVPNARSSHSRPTPRGGGLAIVIVLAVATLAGVWFGFLPSRLSLALLACVPLAVVGFVDDHGHVPARWRFLLQMLAATWVVILFGGVEHLVVAGRTLTLGLAGYPLGVLFLVWYLNLFNFMDGIDGIEGVEVTFVALSASMFMACRGAFFSPESLVLVAVSGATLGFLIWNWPPARIFMGDVGSGVLGFLLALITINSATNGTLSLCVWIILAGVFLVDATQTLMVRLVRGERWYEAHRSHAYQHASRRFGSHRAVTLGILAVDVFWLLPLAMAAVAWPEYEHLLTVLALAPLSYVAYRLGAGSP